MNISGCLSDRTITGNSQCELRFCRWRSMAVDGLKWPLCGHHVGAGHTRTPQGYPPHDVTLELSASLLLVWLAGSATPMLSIACCAELQEVGPAPLRAVSSGLRGVYGRVTSAAVVIATMRFRQAPPAEWLQAKASATDSKGPPAATLTVAEEAAYARAAERLNHVWAHAFGIDCYRTPPRRGGGPRCGTGSSTGPRCRKRRQRRTRMAHRGPGVAASRPSAVINSQSNRSARAT